MNTLREAVHDYLAMRRSLGYKLKDTGRGLLDFVDFLEQHKAAYVTTSLALQWAQKPSSAQPAEWARRLGFVRVFARYRSALDPCTEIPPLGLLPFHSGRARPYIYSDDEISRLLASALRLLPAGALKGWTYYCLLGLLAVSGLRISEAIGLKLEDVDLRECLLTIRGTKFGKSRLVPVHITTRDILADYISRRERLLAGRCVAHLFVSQCGNRLHGSEVRRTFYLLSRQIGLRGPTASHGPRLHDFRHRFALNTLLNWYRSGDDAERRLPALLTYLGHVQVSYTYWYLSASPELMGLAVQRLEQRWEAQ